MENISYAHKKTDFGKMQINRVDVSKDRWLLLTISLC